MEFTEEMINFHLFIYQRFCFAHTNAHTHTNTQTHTHTHTHTQTTFYHHIVRFKLNCEVI